VQNARVQVNLNADQRALASAAVEQLSPELILMWWVSRELDGAMIDLGRRHFGWHEKNVAIASPRDCKRDKPGLAQALAMHRHPNRMETRPLAFA
jgi:hypothetical protein